MRTAEQRPIHSAPNSRKNGRCAATASLTLAAALLQSPAAIAGTGTENWPERYRVDASHTFPSFEIDHLGFSRHRGRFNRTEGTIDLDRPAGRGRIDLRIETGSISTGDTKLEDILRSEAFFHTRAFPEARFRSQSLQFVDQKLTAVDGELTLLGVTRSIRLGVDHFHCGLVILGMRYVCGANATGTLSRSAFGMDKYVNFGLGDEVRLTIQIEAIREASTTSVTP